MKKPKLSELIRKGMEVLDESREAWFGYDDDLNVCAACALGCALWVLGEVHLDDMPDVFKFLEKKTDAPLSKRLSDDDITELGDKVTWINDTEGREAAVKYLEERGW